MRAPHPNIPEPPAPRLQVGDFIADLPARELQRIEGGDTTKMTVKTQGVLVALALQPGQVVTREDLMDRVWPNTFPTGDVLTQAITALRRAFGDNADAPTYVETIAKSGYRLLAPVQWLAEPERKPAEAPQPAAPAEAARPSRRGWLPAVLAVVAIAAGVAWLQRGTPALEESESPAPAPAAESTVIAASTDSEVMPRLSPDGSQVVYARSSIDSRHARLFVQSAMYVEPKPLTSPGPEESDLVPMWSPDGRQIAFQRRDQEGCQLMVVPASGGEPRRVGACMLNVILFYDWLPDASGLITGGLRIQDVPGTLHVLSFETGMWKPLEYVVDEQQMDIEPRVSPDGQWIAFRRGLGPADLWRMPAQGGTPERLTRINTEIWGLDWTADGRGIVFASAEGSKSALFRLDIESREVTPLGVSPAAFPDVAARADVAVFEVPRVRRNLVEVDLAARDPAREPVLASSSNEWAAASDDSGVQLAFYSDRSGKDALWLASRDPATGAFGEALVVEGLVPGVRFPPSWSEDGEHLLLAGTGREGPGLYEIERVSHRARLITLSHDPSPDYASQLDQTTLLVGSRDAENGDRLTLYQREDAQAAWTYVRHRDQIGFARGDRRHGRVVITDTHRNGLFLLPGSLEGEVQTLVSDVPALLGYRAWDLRGDRLWLLLVRNAKDMEAMPVDLPAPGAEVSDMPGTHRYVPLEGNSLSFLLTLGADAEHVILGESTDTGHDIGLVALPQVTEKAGAIPPQD